MRGSLDDMKRCLEGQVERVSLRGNGAATFLFAEHHGRAVELSWNHDAWWIEFWERSKDDDAGPVGEQMAPSDDSAVKATRAWLLGITPGT